MLVAAALLAATAIAGCQDQPDEPTAQPTKSTSAPIAPVDLEFGVYGPPEEVDAYEAMVDEFNETSTDSQVRVVSSPDHDSAVAALRADKTSPDVFLVSRRDLLHLRQAGMTQPVDELLDERGVDFGDGYQRDALQGFSEDNRLQCMPYGISPMVIYYNTDLIDFQKMEARGLDVPEVQTAWTFAEFTAAAEFATRRRTRGVHIDPTLLGLAPFISSGGGTMFNDDTDPTSLAFSDGGTRDALETTMQLLRNPHVTLSQKQLQRRSALEWFKQGRLGMIAGFRSLVPELRRVPGLEFDVMAMPTLEEEHTVGDVIGMCLSAEATDTDAAADFLVHVVAAESVAKVATEGYLVPANLEVSESDAFLQPGRMPAQASIFNTTVRDIVALPLLDSWTDLEEAVAPNLQRLFYVAILDIDPLTEEIDEASRILLDPEVPEEEPSAPEESEE